MNFKETLDIIKGNLSKRFIILFIFVLCIGMINCSSTYTSKQATDNRPLFVIQLETKMDLILQDVQENGPGDRYVFDFDIDGGYKSTLFFEDDGWYVSVWLVLSGGIRSMYVGDGSMFIFNGTTKFPDDIGPHQLGDMKIYVPSDFIGTEFQSEHGTYLTFLFIRPYGLVHIAGAGSVKHSNGEIDTLNIRNKSINDAIKDYLKYKNARIPGE